MKRIPVIRKKGDGKGSLKPRKVKGLLGGEKHTFTVRPYAVQIEVAAWDVQKRPRRSK
jgi:hypothetical protein